MRIRKAVRKPVVYVAAEADFLWVCGVRVMSNDVNKDANAVSTVQA